MQLSVGEFRNGPEFLLIDHVSWPVNERQVVAHERASILNIGPGYPASSSGRFYKLRVCSRFGPHTILREVRDGGKEESKDIVSEAVSLSAYQKELFSGTWIHN